MARKIPRAFVGGASCSPYPRVPVLAWSYQVESLVDISVIVSTFERPQHLERCLASLEAQRGVEGRFEVVVADDGSRDRTLSLVREMARRVPYPLAVTSHFHDGFRLARSRNQAALACNAPYLLFTDGDCILPPDHLALHLKARRPRRVLAGDCIRLSEAATRRVSSGDLRHGLYPRAPARQEQVRLGLKAVRALAYSFARIPMRPRLTGNSIGVWRHDFEAVNGFDEQYVGWGLEDRDLQFRLERIGVRVKSILHHSLPMHLWHAPDESFARNGKGTANLEYFGRVSSRPARCVHGLCSSVCPVPDTQCERLGTVPHAA